MEQLTLFDVVETSKSMDVKAREWVENCLNSTTPPDVPLPYKRILKASFEKAKNPTVTATLEMVDGYKARIRISKYNLLGGIKSWTYQWTYTEGEGYLFYDRALKQWRREVIDF